MPLGRQHPLLSAAAFGITAEESTFRCHKILLVLNIRVHCFSVVVLQPLSSSQWIYHGVNSAREEVFVIADHFYVAGWICLPQTLTFNLHIFSEGIKKMQDYPYVYVMLCFVFSFNYNGFRPKAYLSSLLYFLSPFVFLPSRHHGTLAFHPYGGISSAWQI